MEACLASEACTPPRSPPIGTLTCCQCSPPSAVRRSVPEAPATQKTFALGAAAESSLTVTPETCEAHSLPPLVERRIWPASPNFQTDLPSGEATDRKSGDATSNSREFLLFDSGKDLSSAACELLLATTGACAATCTVSEAAPSSSLAFITFSPAWIFKPVRMSVRKPGLSSCS